VLDLIHGLKDHDVSVILISHRLQDIFAVCDRIMVLRQGQMVGNTPESETNMDEIVALITGAQESAIREMREAG
jgi:simple sugar transport system ATP-binding protein